MDLRLGEAWSILTTLQAESVDAMVTDPPAGISFMAKTWDSSHGGRASWVVRMRPIFEECLRVLRPGAHGLVWALPRTSHWTATALEDAGFDIRDVGVHLFGTGFPKSLNVGDGRGTALKPAAEHWILCRKPLHDTVVANVLAHGTGALNIDSCRIEGVKEVPGTANGKGGKSIAMAGALGPKNAAMGGHDPGIGRWPANLTLDEEAAALLDEQSGELSSNSGEPFRRNTDKFRDTYGAFKGTPDERGFYGDSGGASRFFYVAKPDRGERDIGCYDLPAASGGAATDRQDGSAGLNNPRAGAGRSGGARNVHPTVKPIDLMRWLCRLVTPKGGLVLDPFMGSGTTGIACAREGFRFIGIEREPEYMAIARRRIIGDAPLLNSMTAQGDAAVAAPEIRPKQARLLP